MRLLPEGGSYMIKSYCFLFCGFLFTSTAKADFPSTEKIYENLKKEHYVVVPFPYDHKFLDGAMHSFFRFLTLPDSKKDQLKLSLSKKHRRGDLGFTYRQKSKGHTYNDQKSFFHYHPKLKQKYSKEIEADPVLKDFISRANKIWHAVYDATDQMLKRLDAKYPGVYDKVLKTDSPHIILRFLKYDIRTPGKYLAKPHYDAGSFTFALAESGPGLRIGSCPDDLKPIAHHDRQAVFFLGANIAQLITPDSLKPGWHDVVQMGEKPADNTYARWAIVAFIDGHDVGGAPEALTHKWRVDEKLL
jgi:hypothetical protein